MADRELLEKAAKAAGIEGNFFDSDNPIHRGIYQARGEYYWNPLESCSEALRLAVTLGLEIRIDVSPGRPRMTAVSFDYWDGWAREPHGDDARAATRRAIVRAAAEYLNHSPYPRDPQGGNDA